MATILLMQSEQGAPNPHHRPTFARTQGIAIDGPAIARPIMMAWVRSIPDQFPLGSLCLYSLAEVTVFLPGAWHHGDEAATSAAYVVKIIETT